MDDRLVRRDRASAILGEAAYGVQRETYAQREVDHQLRGVRWLRARYNQIAQLGLFAPFFLLWPNKALNLRAEQNHGSGQNE